MRGFVPPAITRAKGAPSAAALPAASARLSRGAGVKVSLVGEGYDIITVLTQA
jgi:hypothetical protein